MVDSTTKKRAAHARPTQTLIALSLLGLSLGAHAAAQNTAQIDDVVVTATGFQQKANTAAASISVVTQKELEKKAYRDVTDALKDVPGVVVTGGGSSSDISIRGMAGGYTLMLIDGKRVDSRSTRPNSDGSGIEQGWMPPIEAIQRIEVIRGPMSALYGSDAMGGVINIITKKTTQGEWRTSIKTDLTIQENSDSGNQYQANVFTTGPIIPGLLGMRASGLISQRDEDKFLNGYSEQKMRSGNVTFTLTPDEHNDIDFDFSSSIQDRNSTPGKTDAIESCSKGKCTPNSNSDSKYKRTQYALTHTGRYDGINTSNYIQREENQNPGRKMINNNTIFNSKTQFQLGSHSLTLGGEYKDEEIKDQGNQLTTSNPISKLTRYNWSIFAEDVWQMSSDFALTGALRMDKDENFGSHWTPKLYGVWQANPNWIVKGGVSAGYKTPSLRAVTEDWGQATGGSGGNAVILGNPNLKPEKSVTTEIGFIWNNLQGLEIGATAYNNEFKDKITEDRICESKDGEATCSFQGHNYRFISSRMNVDKATMRGLEATLSWQINPVLALNTNYTFTSTKQKSGENKGKALNKMPKHMLNATLDWQAKDNLDLWSRVNFRSKTSDYQGRSRMSEGTPSYTFVDLGLSYKPQKNVNITAGVYNLLDKTIDVDTYDTVLDGRRYNIGATYQF
ncbi:MAG: ligand-gated channel protein [Neisseriaceae bacterium]|nr:ligand-gated channel protein [Neisseriaceae bacterium]MBP6861943.1 ligand-gated channel protein [Neisseriaceae bacterium]